MNTQATKEADDLLEELLTKDEEPKVDYSLGDAWRAMWRHVSPLSHQVVVLAVLGVFSAILNGSVPYVTGRFFDTLILLAAGEVPTWEGFPIWVIFLAIWVSIQFATNITDWVMSNRNEGVWLKLRMNLDANSFAHLLTLPMSFHKSARMGGTINTISNGSWRIGAAVRHVTNISPQFLSMFIGISLTFSINSTLAAILLVGVALYSIMLFLMLRGIAKKDELAHRTWNTAWNYAASAASSGETVKQASAEKRETATIRQMIITRTYKLWYSLETTWSRISFAQRVLVFLTQFAVFVFSIHLIREHMISVGELVAVNGYALMFFGPLVQLGHGWQTIQSGITAAIHLAKLLDTQPEIYSPVNAVAPEKMIGSIEFRDVSFRYEPDQPLVLTNFSANIIPGSVVALVGESGGGKSTAVGLVSGYYFPTEGTVSVDSIDTRIFDLHTLRSQIAIVPQEVTLWNDTIKNNIRYGSFGASDEDVVRVATDAHLAEFIATLPKGYESLVGERGVKLSVGQKQRIAIARAMLRNPAILILDEPTSALDAETEHHVTEALARLMEGRTTLIIAHRLSTVRRADNILVFSKGAIAESGTHDALLQKEGGIYRRLHDHQIGLYG